MYFATTLMTTANIDNLFNESVYHLPDVCLSHHKLISDEWLHICFWLVFAVLCQLIDIFGTITNVVNIICFVKQGFKDPVNVSLL
ncbi:unnamed protein product, partial [Candidula unifasciata]